MSDIEEKIKKIEEEIRTTPYHKGTEHHLGKLRAKLAKLQDQLLTPKKKGGVGFAIKKEGDATVVLLGFPSVGKSTLLNKLTSAHSRIGEYKFTTLTVIPGILKLNGAKIQVLDLPGIISQASLGRGSGKQILSAARAADLLLILVDISSLGQEKIIRDELYKAGVRIEEKRPAVLVKKRLRGGIRIVSPPLSRLNKTQILTVAQEFGLKNGEIIIKEDLTLERLIDSLSPNRVYLPAIFAVNKIDLIKEFHPRGVHSATSGVIKKKFPDRLLISAKENLGLDKLKQAIWQKLGLIRVYLKPKGGVADFKTPLILKRGATVLEAAQRVSQELAQNLKEAQIFGPKALYKGQRVGINFKLEDEIVISFFSSPRSKWERLQ